MRIRNTPSRSRGLLILALCLLPLAEISADGFQGQVLRGIQRVHVDIQGINPNFSRYGLTAEQMRSKAESQLAAHGIGVVTESAASADDAAAQLRIKLNANEDQYAFYFYGVSVQINRKLPLAGAGSAFTSETVWSKGRHGVINPSDWQALYGYVEEIVNAFIAEHGRHNAGYRAAVPG